MLFLNIDRFLFIILKIGNMMRKIKIYLKYFYMPVLLIIISVVCWFKIPNDLNSFQSGLIATILGVGISIYSVEGFKKISEHKRIKRTFGLLKLIVVPYLKDEAETVTQFVDEYKDICDIEKAESFVYMSINFIELLKIFDKSWINLIYSQEFLDAIQKDSQFNKIANTISEVLLFITNMTKYSLNLKKYQNISSQSSEMQNLFIKEIRNKRNEMDDLARKLLKFTEKLEDEIDNFLENTGTKFEYVER